MADTRKSMPANKRYLVGGGGCILLEMAFRKFYMGLSTLGMCMRRMLDVYASSNTHEDLSVPLSGGSSSSHGVSGSVCETVPSTLIIYDR